MLCAKSRSASSGTDRCDRDIMNASNFCNELNAHQSVLVAGLAPVPMGDAARFFQMPGHWSGRQTLLLSRHASDGSDVRRVRQYLGN